MKSLSFSLTGTYLVCLYLLQKLPERTWSSRERLSNSFWNSSMDANVVERAGAGDASCCCTPPPRPPPRSSRRRRNDDESGAGSESLLEGSFRRQKVTRLDCAMLADHLLRFTSMTEHQLSQSPCTRDQTEKAWAASIAASLSAAPASSAYVTHRCRCRYWLARRIASAAQRPAASVSDRLHTRTASLAPRDTEALV
ncbi:Os06g0703400 [Oryza sativa Japonica Group]|uniref:Os06g0703400 protein n=2 Tax=Oryza sativa subsp. japonica TaxID=39947 RepID=Q0D9R1_ORYSJ|nr:hypothetical protein EE612_036349 [Oryza sativa]BAD54037.1 unknown protein [Oryza sativa Japonica Group]BAF20412.1 Os06g0703400 [Oryza sativa Japonica Group]BAS99370.1 Os06g0703400 [Oryza sativa Japonica Group]|eukprot:NP_001058498.1 Os06g0703400 [Oryza sativa Japonica Group]